MDNKIKAVFFDIDNTLYPSALQVELARKNAIKAMLSAGLEVDEKKALKELRNIVKKYGSNYPSHFNKLVQKFHHLDTRIIAAGIVAYHNTKLAYLRPFRETVPTLIRLRELGYKIGVITNGKPIKQWEKLIRLGIDHFFHTVIISEEVGKEKPNKEIFEIAVKALDCKPEEALMVGDKIDLDIAGANKVGMVTVQILRGEYKKQKPKNQDEKPDYLIPNLKKLLEILKKKKKRKRDYKSG